MVAAMGLSGVGLNLYPARRDLIYFPTTATSIAHLCRRVDQSITGGRETK